VITAALPSATGADPSPAPLPWVAGRRR
jgi:hypothetical protein